MLNENYGQKQTNKNKKKHNQLAFQEIKDSKFESRKSLRK